MDIFHVEVAGGNFGDDMNLWFWDALMPERAALARGTTLFGIGSILWRANFAKFDRIVVMGSGSGYGTTPDAVPPHVDVAWVRGPRTAARMGLGPRAALTDPAALLPRLPAFAEVEGTDETLLIPHVGTARLPLDWNGIAARAGAAYLSPAGDARTIIRAIAGARRVVTESLHGAIIADAFRVPWTVIALSPTFNHHKFGDWGDSLEMAVDVAPALAGPKRLLALKRRLRGGAGDGARKGMSAGDKGAARRVFGRFPNLFGALLARDVRAALARRPQLSDAAILARRQDAMLDRIETVRTDLARAATVTA